MNIISIFKKNLFQQEKLSKNTENQNKTKQTNKKQQEEESQVAKRPQTYPENKGFFLR